MADQTYTTIDITREQLDDAISLLEKGSFASAMTLASAADKILDEMLSERVKLSYLEYKYEDLGPVLTKLLPLSKEDFINENCALITIMRMASTSTPSITPDDLEHEAQSKIVRALYNYDHLCLLHTARMLEFKNRLLEFDNCFYENVVGRMIYAEEVSLA
jgi:hypothetical protein